MLGGRDLPLLLAITLVPTPGPAFSRHQGDHGIPGILRALVSMESPGLPARPHVQGDDDGGAESRTSVRRKRLRTAPQH